MRFTFDYDRAEFVRAYHATNRHSESKLLRRGPLVVGVLAALAAVGGFAIHGEWGVFLMRLVPWLLIIAIWMLLFSRFLGPTVARQYEKQQEARHPHGAAFDDDGYEATTAAGTTRRHWPAIRRAVETPEFLLMYFSKQWAYYLPKRAIPSDDELRAVRRLLREKLGARAELLDDSAPRP